MKRIKPLARATRNWKSKGLSAAILSLGLFLAVFLLPAPAAIILDRIDNA
jgi:hypothetical protein